MRELAALIFISALISAGGARAQVQPLDPTPPVACKPCWIEPWYCKAPHCPPTPTKPRPTPRPEADSGRPPLVHETLTGVVKSFGVVQEEPGETPQAVFYLTIVGADAHPADVLVGMPVFAFRCAEGDRATLEGDVGANERDRPSVLMGAHIISCGPQADR